MSDTQHSGPHDVSRLTPGERAAKYRAFAEMHLAEAEKIGDAPLRAARLELAALWMRLAAAAERQQEPSSPEARWEALDRKSGSA